MQKLRQIYLALGISDCSMEEGSMRCDGNVSLRRRGAKEFGVKTELKNMNSFKNLHDGLAYEICRQAEVLEEGGQIFQETRHWDPSAKRTIVMRVKETADDYRLFPDPDLAPYDLTDEWIDSVRAKLPELPDQKAARFEDAFGLSAYDARHLVEHRATADFFEACMELAGADAAKLAKPVANLVINDVTAYLTRTKAFSWPTRRLPRRARLRSCVSPPRTPSRPSRPKRCSRPCSTRTRIRPPSWRSAA